MCLKPSFQETRHFPCMVATTACGHLKNENIAFLVCVSAFTFICSPDPDLAVPSGENPLIILAQVKFGAFCGNRSE